MADERLDWIQWGRQHSNSDGVNPGRKAAGDKKKEWQPMQVWPRQRVSDLYLEIGYQLEDLRRTWANDVRARLWVWAAVAAGLSVVLLAIGVDVLRYLDVHHYRARFLSLTTDRGLPELVMDSLVLIAAALTARLFFRSGLPGFLFVAGLLCFVALDDFFGFHESFGFYVVDRLALPDIAGVDGNALAELAFMVLFGLVSIPFFLWAVWGLQPANLAVLVIYGVFFALFAAFSAGADFLHSFAQSSFMDRLMGWIEDGGEILVMTGLTAVAILQSRSRLSA
jgi:hypothetical protein